MDRLTSFLQGEMSRTSRILVVIAALAILPALFLPVWRITLQAPQYPAGLDMIIYPSTVGGDLHEVNILNHYIGMQHIDADEFPEFKLLPFFILRFLAFAVLAALVGRMPIAAIGYIDFIMFGIVMLFDFQGWLAAYGTNLSPDAPITMAPFVPKFLGTTHVANFTVISRPAIGAILMGLAGLMGPIALGYDWIRFRKQPATEAAKA